MCNRCAILRAKEKGRGEILFFSVVSTAKKMGTIVAKDRLCT